MVVRHCYIRSLKNLLLGLGDILFLCFQRERCENEEDCEVLKQYLSHQFLPWVFIIHNIFATFFWKSQTKFVRFDLSDWSGDFAGYETIVSFLKIR